MPQGEGFMKWSDPALLLMLFSDNHGLFTWTPIVAVALVGLVPFRVASALRPIPEAEAHS